MAFPNNSDNSGSAYFREIWHHCNKQEFSRDESSITFRCASISRTPQIEKKFHIQGKGAISSPLRVTGSKRDEHNCWDMDIEQDKQDPSVSSVESRNPCNSDSRYEYSINGSDEGSNVEVLLQTSKWHVSSKYVPVVPFYYPLESTHVVIPLICMSTELVAALICSLCQKLSLAAEYNHENAIATLTASDGSHFLVRLFAQEDDVSETMIGTIVECQKISGESETYYRNALKLLQVSKGLKHVKSMTLNVRPKLAPFGSFSEWKAIRPESRDVEQLLELPILVDEQSELKLAFEQVEWAAELLNKDRTDANKLGMEMLISMTDITNSSAITCSFTGTSVLRGYIAAEYNNINGKDNTHNAVKLNLECAFAGLIEPSPDARDEAGMKNENENEEVAMFSSSHLSRMSLLSMQLLENALRVCYTNGCEDVQEDLLNVRMPSSSWLLRHMDLIVSGLVQHIRAADAKPHHAVLAIKCLESLLQISSTAKDIAHAQNIVQAVRCAMVIGESSHAILAVESSRLYRALTSTRARN